MTRLLFNRLWAAFSAVLVLWIACSPGLVSAQQNKDRQAPVIEYSSASTFTPSARQVFSITVTDNIQVASVILHYRFKGQNTYLQKNMVALSNNVYAATVGTSPDSTLDIQYFIRASDSAGLVTNRGFAYQPITRVITRNTPSKTPAVSTSTAASATDQPPVKTKLSTKMLYVVGALVVAGALSAASNDDGGGSSTGSSQVIPSNDGCQADSCPLVFVLPPPQ